MTEGAEHNVMLESGDSRTDDLKGKPFPCPVCNMALAVAISQKGKPYCICNSCGIQLFFRGKAGIKRLKKLLETEKPIPEDFPGVTLAVSLYNRLEKLRQQRNEMEQKQGIIFRDQDLDNAIVVMDREIKRVQADLEKTKKEAEKKI